MMTGEMIPLCSKGFRSIIKPMESLDRATEPQIVNRTEVIHELVI